MSGSVLNFSLPTVNVSFPSPGQSILAVALERNNVDCITYVCTATNGLGMQNATARVCPQRERVIVLLLQVISAIGIETLYTNHQIN